MNFHNPITRAQAEFRQKSAGERADDKSELADVMEALAARDAEIKAFATKADKEITDHGKILGETKSALERLAQEGTGLQQRLLDVEQKLARRAGGGEPATKGLGEQFTDTDEFKALQTRGKGSARLKVKAVTTVTSATTGTGAAGALIRPDRRPEIITPAQRTLTIRNLLLPGRTASNVVEYVRETGFQNMAAPVVEGALKPQSDLRFDLVQTTVKTLAHWILASKQVLADIPLLQSYVELRMTYGLALVEEAQILGGDGTGQNLLGLIPQATPYGFASYSKASDTKLDRLRRAILQVRVAEYRASGFVLNPIDWADIQTIKDSQGRYLWSDPVVANGNNIWGIPVVDTNAVAPGKFMCGAFNIAAQIFDREDASVEVSNEDADNFRKNLVTILAEERVALAVTRPESFVYGNIADGNAS
jgi:HK97 family phage major capsid protein